MNITKQCFVACISDILDAGGDILNYAGNNRLPSQLLDTDSP